MSADHKFGCPECGKIGCDCELIRSFEALCKKCRSDPCECAGKPVARTTGDVCVVCHRTRTMCICTSHFPVRQMADHTLDKQQPTVRPYTDKYLDTLVNEGMLFYINRDAVGLARWLRRALR